MTADRIETAEALDALPVGSVVIDADGDAWGKDAPGRWGYNGQQIGKYHTSVVLAFGPLRVSSITHWMAEPEPIDVPAAGLRVTREAVEAAGRAVYEIEFVAGADFIDWDCLEKHELAYFRAKVAAVLAALGVTVADEVQP